MIQIPKSSIDFNLLPQIAKAKPEMTRFLLGLQEIDLKLKEHIRETVITRSNKSEEYYVKTELESQCYMVSIFNSDRRATISFSIPLSELLVQCSNKTIHFELEKKIIKVLDRFEKNNEELSTRKINWLY